MAERVRTLGHRPLGSMEAMLSHNHIPEFSMTEAVPQEIDMWKHIRDDWDRMVRVIRDIHAQIPENDLATLNFLEDMIECKVEKLTGTKVSFTQLESMEKEAWMNRSYNVTPAGN